MVNTGFLFGRKQNAGLDGEGLQSYPKITVSSLVALLHVPTVKLMSETFIGQTNEEFTILYMVCLLTVVQCGHSLCIMYSGRGYGQTLYLITCKLE